MEFNSAFKGLSVNIQLNMTPQKTDILDDKVLSVPRLSGV